MGIHAVSCGCVPACDIFRPMSYAFTKIGSLMAGGGVIWATYMATSGLRLGEDAIRNAAAAVFTQRGPLEVCAIGILLWMLGKWRGHVVVR